MNENEEPRPSTSKQDQDKRSHKTNSNNEIDKPDEHGSSLSSMSNTHSENSNVEMGHERVPMKVKKERKPKERKIRGRLASRVGKKLRNANMKRATRGRQSKRLRDSKKKRELSISTIFTRLSSNMSMMKSCPHCGHRCCRRRFYKTKRNTDSRSRNFSRRKKLRLKCMATQTSVFKVENFNIQAGSRCLMLSPLCLDTNATPEPIPEELGACEITPEMIYETLRRLTMWRQHVNTDYILDYIKRRYPVGLGDQLLAELTEKLRIAAIVGFVTQTGEDLWRLTCELEERKITRNHVTLFWKIYADTMKPVVKKSEDVTREPGHEQESNTVKDGVNGIPNIFKEYI